MKLPSDIRPGLRDIRLDTFREFILREPDRAPSYCEIVLMNYLMSVILSRRDETFFSKVLY